MDARRLTPPERLAIEVLIAHQRTNTSGCHCGGVRLGGSHAEHLLEQLLDAGLLVVAKPERLIDISG